LPGTNDRRLILAAVLLRSLATGMMGPLLGFYLAGLSYDERTIGFLVSAGLAGAALATAWVTLFGRTLCRRTALLAVTALSLVGGAVAALATGPLVIGTAAFVGMLNGMGRDRGASLVIEQAMLPETTSEAGRTRTFAWYSVMQDAGTALGSLLSGLPGILRTAAALEPLPALRVSIGVYLALVAIGAVPYLRLSRDVAAAPAGAGLVISRRSRGILAKICALFAIDSVAGGFLTATFLALFFKARFGADEATVAVLFFARSMLNALSHIGAASLARRIGLINTMVFTHIPSSLLLVTVTIAPSLAVAAALFLLREALVEMDVPTRTSYVMAVVQRDERTLASGLTHLVRMGGWAIAPASAGLVAASADSLAVPLWIGAGMKIAYDVLLYAAFRRMRPPEES
jgi:predicted MFS family arabinose efflux permease